MPVQSYAGVDDLATRSAVPVQSYAGVDDLATRSAVPAQSYAGVDDLATRFTVSEAIRFAGSDDLATQSSVVGASGIVEQSILDAFEELSGAVSSAVPAQSYAGVDDLATRFTVSEAIRYATSDDLATRFTASEAIRYAGADDLATRSAAGSSGAVTHSALDPFETQTASPQTRAAVGATGLSPQEIEQLRGEAMVEYFTAQSASSAVAHSALDPFEERSGAVSPAVVGTTGPRYAGSDDLSAR